MSTLSYLPHELYRRLHLGNEGDITFYLRAMEGATSVLDLGCGWGRLSLPLSDAGYRVTAVDMQSEFLDELREAAQLKGFSHLKIQQQDIRELPTTPEERYDRIFIPYNTLYALGGATGVESCLRAARSRLNPQGEIWFDAYAMDAFHESYDPKLDEFEDDDPVAQWTDGQARVLVFEHTEVQHEKQRLIVTYDALIAENSSRVGELKMNHDYLLESQWLALLDGCELELAGRFFGFTPGEDMGSMPDEDGPVVYVAQAKSASP